MYCQVGCTHAQIAHVFPGIVYLLLLAKKVYNFQFVLHPEDSPIGPIVYQAVVRISFHYELIYRSLVDPLGSSRARGRGWVRMVCKQIRLEFDDSDSGLLE